MKQVQITLNYDRFMVMCICAITILICINQTILYSSVVLFTGMIIASGSISFIDKTVKKYTICGFHKFDEYSDNHYIVAFIMALSGMAILLLNL